MESKQIIAGSEVHKGRAAIGLNSGRADAIVGEALRRGFEKDEALMGETILFGNSV